MMSDRRNFLKNSVLASLGILALNQTGLSSILSLNESIENETLKKQVIGIQLYTFRNEMKNDPVATLKHLAQIGYKNLELTDYKDGKFYGFTPNEFKKITDDLGFKIISSHFNFDENGIDKDKIKIIADAHAKLGVLYCINPWVNEDKRKSIVSYQRLVENWNKIGQIMKSTGLQFGYHNHAFEFENVEGKIPYYDVYMKEMDSDLITMELDLYWLIHAKQDPFQLFKNYPGRFQIFHLKDMDSKGFFAPVGEGSINFKHILSAKKAAGLKYLFVEQDDTNGRDPFDCVRSSLKNINTKILK